MFRVFISAASLEKLCLEEMSKDQNKQNSWFLLLSKQNIIYLDKNIYDEWEYNDALFTFSESYQIEFQHSKMDYNTLAKESPETLLAEPQGAFLLDVDKETEKYIQKKYANCLFSFCHLYIIIFLSNLILIIIYTSFITN